MIKIGPQYTKLKTDLHLACNRLKIRQAKKTELTEKMRRQIANNLTNSKFVNANMKAQMLIKEEASVEAMQLIEMFCEQILSKYGIFEEKSGVDPCLEQAVTSVMWVSPYLRSEIFELKNILKQLSVKYGRDYTRSALKNKHGTVSLELIQRVKGIPASKEKIYQYLLEISKQFDVPQDKREEMERYLTQNNSNDNSKSRRNSSMNNFYKKNKKKNENVEIFEGWGMKTSDTSLTCKKICNDLKPDTKRKKSIIRRMKNIFISTLIPVPEEIKEFNEEFNSDMQSHRAPQENVDTRNVSKDPPVNENPKSYPLPHNMYYVSPSTNMSQEKADKVSDSKNMVKIISKYHGYNPTNSAIFMNNNILPSNQLEENNTEIYYVNQPCLSPIREGSSNFLGNNSNYIELDAPPPYSSAVFDFNAYNINSTDTIKPETELSSNYTPSPTCPSEEIPQTKNEFFRDI